MSKPVFTLKDGTQIKYTGKREVKAVWSFDDIYGNTFGGFSLNAKIALDTASKNFKSYTDGGYELVNSSIMVNQL